MVGLKKILVVDDNSANLTVINGILNGSYKVYPVDSGATAMKFMERQMPDLILLDIEMPVMSGEELFHAIRSNPKFDHVPIIFLTAHDDVKNEVEAFKMGASDYVRKPINDVILLKRVELHLELSGLRMQARNK